VAKAKRVNSYAVFQEEYQRLLDEHSLGPGIFGGEMAEEGFGKIGMLVAHMRDFVIRKHADIYAPFPAWQDVGGAFIFIAPGGKALIWYVKAPQDPADVPTYKVRGASVRHPKLYELPNIALNNAWQAAPMSSGDLDEMLLWCEMLNAAVERLKRPDNPLV
jgi:hypothetical protein